MIDVTKLREKREDLLARSEKMAAETLDAKQTEEFNSLISEIDEVEQEIRTAKVSNKREQGKLDFDFPVIEPTVQMETHDNREAFLEYCRGNISHREIRELVKGTDASGGYTVPTEWGDRIVEKRLKYNQIRSLANVISVNHDRNIPVEANYPASAYIAEGGTYTSGDTMTFGTVALSPNKTGTIIKVAEELLQDTGYDLEGYIINQAAKSLGVLEESKFISGVGDSEPKGFLTSGDTGVSAGDTVAFTAAEILSLVYSLKEEYANEAVIWMKRATLATVIGLKHPNVDTRLAVYDVSKGRYTIEGIPIYQAAGMPASTTGLKPIAICDMSYFTIADRVGFSIQRLDELYAATGYVAFKFTARNDGQLLLSEACKFIEMA